MSEENTTPEVVEETTEAVVEEAKEEVAEAPEVAAVQSIDEQPVTTNDTSVESNAPVDNAKVETVASKADAVAIPPEADEVIVQTTQSAPEMREEESKPANKPKAKKAPAKSTKVSASVSKARASHPMATPASVEHEFSTLNIGSLSDDARPSVNASGRSAAMVAASTRSGAPATRPASQD